MGKELPKGWVETELENIVDILDNKRKPVSAKIRASRQGDIPYYGATGVAGNIDDYIFDEELVLLGEDGAPFFDRNKNVAFIISGKSWVNNHAHVLRARNITSNKFVESFLNQFNYEGFVGGTTRLKLNQGNLKSIPFLLPPRAEQDRIVAKVDLLMAQHAAIQQAMERIPQLLKDFRQQVLTQAVTGKLTKEWRLGKELEEWETLNSNDVFSFITSGSRGWAKYYNTSGNQLFVRITNMNFGTIHLDLSENKLQFLNLPENNEGKRTLLKENDILISITGDVGMVSLIQGNFKFEAYVNQHVCLARPTTTHDAKFIAYYLMSKEGFGQLESKKRGATKAGLTLGDIRSLSIKIPPLQEQQEIVRRVESLFEKATAIEQRYEQLKTQIDSLPQAILHKAFKGELVEQLDSDGSASELLREIEEMRANSNLKSKSKSKPRKSVRSQSRASYEVDEKLGNVAESGKDYKKNNK